MAEPYLFRFKQECSTKISDDEQFYYDNEFDMIMMKDNNRTIPAICHNGDNVPRTKKADMEKGEDSKDTMMWP